MPILSDDIEGLYNLSRSLEWLHTPDEWALMLQTSKLFTVRDEFKCCASALLTTYSSCAAIGMVLTDREHGRLGLGRALTTMALNKAMKMGIENISLIASHEAEALYRKLGFSEVGAVSILARTSVSALVQPNLRTPHDLPSAQTISKKYYEDCPSRAKVLELYMTQSHGAFDFAIAGDQLTGFVGSVLRKNAKGDESLAIGPLLADMPEIAKRLIAKLATNNLPLTCFIVSELAGSSANSQTDRKEIYDEFIKNGFALVDKLPLMTHNGVLASQYANPAVLSPISLALG